jgi:hypothetical protein
MHFGLLSSKTDTPSPREHRLRPLGAEKAGESIPSVNDQFFLVDFYPSLNHFQLFWRQISIKDRSIVDRDRRFLLLVATWMCGR